MPTSQMEAEPDLRPAQDSTTAVGPQLTLATSVPVGTDPLDALGQAGYLGTRPQVEAELDLIAAVIRTFHRLQPDQVMRYCAGFSARLTELTVQLHRVESTNRQYTRLRTQQVQKYLEELDRQFKIASRMVEVMRQDIDLMGRAT